MIFIRELFAVFSGNELILSISLAIWLLACASGSRFSRKFVSFRLPWLTFFYLFSCLAGIIIIRVIPRLLLPGELSSPIRIIAVILVAEIPCSFIAGVLFGVLAEKFDGRLLFRWENTGNLAGLVLLSLAFSNNVSHLLIVFTSSCFLLPVILENRRIFCIAISCLLAFIVIDSVSNKWKYNRSISFIIYGREGEVAIDRTNDLILLNNQVYRTGFSNPLTEQSVHIPLSIGKTDRILLIHDNGHSAEIRKYHPSKLVCLESEPALADSGCICQTPERLSRNDTFDIVLLGCDVPENIAMNRMFTDAFFHRVKYMMTDSGLFSFTLNLNSNYLDVHERKLKDLFVTTLLQVFKFVKIFPGQGWTFVASDIPLEFVHTCNVATDYYKDFILTSVRPEEIIAANQNVMNSGVNKVTHPLAIKYALERYLDKFHIEIHLIIYLAVLILAAVMLSFLRKGPFFSIGTTGFCTGSYNIVIMMLYQSVFGTLYSRVSLLMVAISAGFVVGTCLKKLPQSDIIVGLYAVFSLFFLSVLKNPPEVFFFIGNMVMGILAAAQITSYREFSWAQLNAADLAGGVAGMGLVGIIILPSFGLWGVISLMAMVKAVSFITHSPFQSRQGDSEAGL